MQYVNDNYTPDNFIISIAGNFKYNEIIAYLKDNLNHIKKNIIANKKNLNVNIPQIIPSKFIKYKKYEIIWEKSKRQK